MEVRSGKLFETGNGGCWDMMLTADFFETVTTLRQPKRIELLDFSNWIALPA